MMKLEIICGFSLESFW